MWGLLELYQMLNFCSPKEWTILWTLCSMATSAQFFVIEASMQACNYTVLTSLIIVCQLMHNCYLVLYVMHFRNWIGHLYWLVFVIFFHRAAMCISHILMSEQIWLRDCAFVRADIIVSKFSNGQLFPCITCSMHKIYVKRASVYTRYKSRVFALRALISEAKDLTCLGSDKLQYKSQVIKWIVLSYSWIDITKCLFVVFLKQ